MTNDRASSSNLRQEALKRFVARASAEASSDSRLSEEIEHLSAIAQEARQLRQAYAEEIEALKRRGARRRTLRQAGGAALALALCAAGIIAAFSWRDVRTPLGKPVAYAFSDGSRVYLDAGGVLEVPLAPWRRQARLVGGDAVFDIVHDEAKPFVVHAVSSTLADLGTRFLVRSGKDAIEVAVFDGKVELGSMTGHRMVLGAGQAASSGPRGIAGSRMPDEGEATAWSQGRLLFRQTPLDQVVERLARYAGQPIVLKGPGLADLKLSGSFRLDDIDGALKTLETALPVRISRRDGRVVIEPQPRQG